MRLLANQRQEHAMPAACHQGVVGEVLHAHLHHAAAGVVADHAHRLHGLPAGACLVPVGRDKLRCGDAEGLELRRREGDHQRDGLVEVSHWLAPIIAQAVGVQPVAEADRLSPRHARQVGDGPHGEQGLPVLRRRSSVLRPPSSVLRPPSSVVRRRSSVVRRLM